MPSGLRILVIGDLHAQWERLDRVLDGLRGRPDVVLFAGDVGLDPPWSEPQRTLDRELHDDSVREAIARVRRAFDVPVAFVPGNHDLRRTAPDLERFNADGRVLDLAGLRVAGLGGAGPARFGFPYEWSEREADARLERLLTGDGMRPDVLLCHTPPADTALDLTVRGRHVGSRAVRRWIRRGRPRLFVCGHIHEAFGMQHLGNVPCLNAGALGEPFGRPMAWTVAWNRGPTHVECIVWPGGSDLALKGTILSHA